MLITFCANSGIEYELEVEADPAGWHRLAGLVIIEDEMGYLTASNGDHWDCLAEMTHDLSIEIVSWTSDPGN